MSKRASAGQRGNAPGRQGLTSKVTYRWQTTLPSGVRRALGLNAGDQITYVIEDDQVVIRKAEGDDDPVVEAYLEFLGKAMSARPDLITPFTHADIAGLEDLLHGVETDLDEDLGDFELP
jgi:antitoxin PrlF